MVWSLKILYDNKKKLIMTRDTKESVLHETELVAPLSDPYETRPGEKPYIREIIWFNVVVFIYLHIASLYVLGITDLNSRSTYWFSELEKIQSHRMEILF